MATDGPLGSIADVYLDDEDWRVRYLVVDAADCLPGGLLLVPLASVADDVAVEGAVRLRLGRQQASALVREDERHLRSGMHVLGAAVEGAGGRLGEVDDVTLDDEWRVLEIVVRTHGGAPMRVPRARVTRFNCAARRLFTPMLYGAGRGA